MTTKTGTREWSSSSVNVVSGCSNRCRMCYAAANAIRFGQHTRESWGTETPRPGAEHRVYNRRKGTIMFPTTHDIARHNWELCLSTIAKMSIAGNRILVVSKPDRVIMQRVLEALDHPDHKARIVLRFTIGSMNSRRLSWWEPGAPSFASRLYSLMWAFEHGWTTSVSMEPILDLTISEVVNLALTVAPYVTETIWIGTANHLKQRVSINCGELDEVGKIAVENLSGAWTAEPIKALVGAVEGLPELRDKVRWKDSIRKVIDA